MTINAEFWRTWEANFGNLISENSLLAAYATASDAREGRDWWIRTIYTRDVPDSQLEATQRTFEGAAREIVSGLGNPDKSRKLEWQWLDRLFSAGPWIHRDCEVGYLEGTPASIHYLAEASKLYCQERANVYSYLDSMDPTQPRLHRDYYPIEVPDWHSLASGPIDGAFWSEYRSLIAKQDPSSPETLHLWQQITRCVAFDLAVRAANEVLEARRGAEAIDHFRVQSSQYLADVNRVWREALSSAGKDPTDPCLNFSYNSIQAAFAVVEEDLRTVVNRLSEGSAAVTGELSLEAAARIDHQEREAAEVLKRAVANNLETWQASYPCPNPQSISEWVSPFAEFAKRLFDARMTEWSRVVTTRQELEARMTREADAIVSQIRPDSRCMSEALRRPKQSSIEINTSDVQFGRYGDFEKFTEPAAFALLTRADPWNAQVRMEIRNHLDQCKLDWRMRMQAAALGQIDAPVTKLDARQYRTRPAQPTEAERQFSNRATWLNERLRERSWNKHDLQRHRGPHHKTIQKVLNGLPVREEVLEKLAEALSKRRDRVDVVDIPQD
jgi:hypothetical protein